MKQFAELENSVSFAHDLSHTLRKENFALKKELNSVKKKNVQLENQVKKLDSVKGNHEERLDYLSDQSRRNNLIFSDVPENKYESWEQSEKKILI